MIRLTKERQAKGWTRAKLGGKADVHPATLGMIESGRYIPYAGQLGRLAQALNFMGDALALMEEVEP